jgi:holo-[acyl-carrier protein] synthase
VILSIGTDLAEVPRIRDAHARFGDRFLQRVFTPHEIAYSLAKANRFERLAARFAAKEALMKAIGTGLTRGVSWHDVEVLNLPSGRPTLRLSGQAAVHAQGLGARFVHVSLTHTATMAMAVVILED